MILAIAPYQRMNIQMSKATCKVCGTKVNQVTSEVVEYFKNNCYSNCGIAKMKNPIKDNSFSKSTFRGRDHQFSNKEGSFTLIDDIISEQLAPDV